MPLTHDDLTRFLIDNLFVEDQIDPETPLFSSGLLDSVSMVNLIGFIEEKTNATVHPEDVTLDNFDTPVRIASYAARLA